MGKTISVTGEGVAPCTPDAVRVEIEVPASLRATRDAVSDRLIVKVGAVRNDVERAGSIRKIRVVAPEIHERRETEEPRLRLGWEGRQLLRVELTDPREAKAVVTSAMGAGAHVRSVAWVIDADNAAYDEAWTAATRDARRRATAYADGLGVMVGGVLRVDEHGDGGTGMEIGVADAFWGGPGELFGDAAVRHVRASVSVDFEVGSPR